MRYKELFTLYDVMSVGYAELFSCKVSIISAINQFMENTVKLTQ